MEEDNWDIFQKGLRFLTPKEELSVSVKNKVNSNCVEFLSFEKDYVG